VSAAFDAEFREQEEERDTCPRCGRKKAEVKKRENRERMCETCWVAISQEPPGRVGPMTSWDV
jgi:hypothetical protein